jgi:release factor glutamine methyltransferase
VNTCEKCNVYIAECAKLINKYSCVIPRIESELLLSYLLNIDRGKLYTDHYPVTKDIEKTFNSFVKRRMEGEPLQYITGTAEFMDMEFMVTKDVLIPRPETEMLVNEVKNDTLNKLKILDLCTGSGNIAVSLAKLIPDSEIIAADISGAALNIAKQNAVRHGVDKKVTFYKGNLFQALPFDKKYKFDIIVCNPPYVKASELALLQKEVTFEPVTALNGGDDGLDFYRRISKYAKDYLKQDGALFLEMGLGQSGHIKELFDSEGYRVNKIIKDFAGIDRCISIKV